MDTQFTITYQIDDPFTDERFVVNEEHQARHFYDESCTVTEIHTTVTLLPPFALTENRGFSRWHDKDPEYNYHEPESEEELE